MADQTTTEDITSVLRRTRLSWLLRGIVAIIIGILVLIWPGTTVSILAVLLGIYFVILGIVRIVQGLTSKDLAGGGKVANVIIGALILAAGVIVVRNPFETAVFVVLLIGVSWIFEGIATLVDTARGYGSGLTVVIGVLIALAGVLVILFADTATLAWGIFVGISLLAVGLLDLILSFAVGRGLAQEKN